MLLIRWRAFALLLFTGLSLARAQSDLSGIINVYTVLTTADPCVATLTVEDATDFTPGMGVLIIQMQGATINGSDGATFGDVESLEGTGHYEYNRIRSVNGNELQLERQLLYDYDQNGHTQIVGFPILDQATVVDTLRPQPWNGRTGGVLALEVRDTLILRAPIDASGSGFRGMQSGPAAENCSWTQNFTAYYYAEDDWRAAPKGEGIALFSTGKEWGRGAQANGGGGGNDHNAGGGGGANVSRGGQGGENQRPSTFRCAGRSPGVGGKALPALDSLLFLGGGGGSGHHNDPNPSKGGNGGGIIVLRAGALRFDTGGKINANGQSAVQIDSDGAGGGGAGGTIVIQADTILGAPQISLRGGNGGTVDNLNAIFCMGPGGGGSGGHLLTNLPLTADLAAGTAGLTTNSTTCGEGTNGAQNGQPGLTTPIDSLPAGSLAGGPAGPIVSAFPADTTVCGGSPLVLSASILGASTFQWQESPDGNSFSNLTNDTNYSGVTTGSLRIALPAGTRYYRLHLTDACGNEVTSESVSVTATDAAPTPAFTYAVAGSTVTFTNTSMGADTYSWDFGDGSTSTEATPSHTYAQDGTYTVSLTATSSCGTQTITQQVTVTTGGGGGQAPQAVFTADPTQGCAPLTVSFTNQSTGTYDSLSWTFPGGSPENSSDPDPEVLFVSPGAYQAVLIVSGPDGADTQAVNIVVLAEPAADFSAATSELTVTLTNQSMDAESYSWDFGDGATSTEASPSHTYAQGGTYTVTLTASNACGSTTSTQQVTVTPGGGGGQAPLAGFSASTQEGCGPLEVTFTNQSTGNFTSLNWVFTGGLPGGSTDPNPTVTFPDPGTFPVTLTVSGPDGADTQLVNVVVLPQPAAGFTSTTNDLTVSFTNTSTGATTYAWDFGDGNTSTEPNPSHSYAQQGAYTVTLTATNTCGSQIATQQVLAGSGMPQAQFTASTTSGCQPVEVTFTSNASDADSIRWEFPGGDPATSTEPAPVVTYYTAGQFTVRLIAYGNGTTDTLTQTDYVNVSSPPEAFFNANISDLTVEFLSITEFAQSVRWDFGDGNTSTDFSPTHTYVAAGVYNVMLVVGNDLCGETEYSQAVRVGQAPQAGFTANQFGGCAPLQIRFTNQSSGSYETLLWSFPGGSPATSTEEEPRVRYELPGEYSVELTISGSQGTAMQTSKITVYASPTTNFTFTIDGQTVTFTNQTTGATGYVWDFGDGNTSTEANPVYTYPQAGVYDVTLSAQDGTCGRATSRTLAVGLTDVTDLASAGIRLYPNPTDGHLRLEGLPGGRVTLYSAEGRQLRQWPLIGEIERLDITDQPAGWYFLRLEREEKVWLVQIAKR